MLLYVLGIQINVIERLISVILGKIWVADVILFDGIKWEMEKLLKNQQKGEGLIIYE